MSGLHTKLPVENSTRLSECEQDEEMPYLPLDQHVPVHVLGRRRHGISGASESPYRSKPRMWRRGAISYERNDAAAEYIRYLGKALVTCTLARTCTRCSVPHCICTKSWWIWRNALKCENSQAAQCRWCVICVDEMGGAFRKLKVHSGEVTTSQKQLLTSCSGEKGVKKNWPHKEVDLLSGFQWKLCAFVKRLLLLCDFRAFINSLEVKSCHTWTKIG